MWKIKEWKLSERGVCLAWIEKNKGKFQIVEIFVNNGYGVQYKPLNIL